jgi:hypothetical protein
VPQFDNRFRRRLVAVATALTLVATMLIAGPASAYATNSRIDLKVLVVTNGSSNVELITAQLDREGVPYTSLNLNDPNRPTITTSYLVGSWNGVARAYFQGVVLPNETALPPVEMSTLDAYERAFKVRRILAYTWAGPGVGLTTQWAGSLDGEPMTVTAAAKSAGFGYLTGQVQVEDRSATVDESYAYLATANAGVTYTPFVTATSPDGTQTGSLLGVYARDNREELVMTLAANQHQTHAMVLGHALVTWLTRGVHLGHWRNWFGVHIDDIFLPDDRWHTGANCTVGDDCNPARDPNAQPHNQPIRMVPADVTELLAWQQRQNFKLDMAFNGAGSVEAGATDPLSASLLANRSQFRWINHTYDHAYLGCVQDFSVIPWRCTRDGSGAIQYVSQAEITAQIRDNLQWAQGKGISLNAQEVVTGEHSGLRSLPQMTVDNPNLAPALNATGVRFIASDNSRESQPRSLGNAETVPRFPMNIFYNVATYAEEVDEYNWIYTSRANGGSGICEDNPTTSTCIQPLNPQTGFSQYIVPIETEIAYSHIVSTNPRPHYAHQSNITEDRILYPLLDAILARYRATFTTATPVLNPRFAEVSQQLARQRTWQAAQRAGTVEAYLHNGRVTVVNRAVGTVDVPITVPTGTRVVTLGLLGIEVLGGPYGEAYGGEQSAWKSLPTGGQQLLRLPA